MFIKFPKQRLILAKPAIDCLPHKTCDSCLAVWSMKIFNISRIHEIFQHFKNSSHLSNYETYTKYENLLQDSYKLTPFSSHLKSGVISMGYQGIINCLPLLFAIAKVTPRRVMIKSSQVGNPALKQKKIVLWIKFNKLLIYTISLLV